MYHMMNNGPGVSSVTVLVRGMTGNNDLLLNKSTVLHYILKLGIQCSCTISRTDTLWC